MNDSKKYDFTISFAGQDRDIAEDIVNKLKSNGATVFYDYDEQHDLLGKDLYEHLIGIYRDRATYCIMLVSKNYQTRLWTNHERKAAQNRAFNSSSEYILPIRLDDTKMESLLDTIGYLDYQNLGAQKVAEILISKLWGAYRDNIVLKKVNAQLTLLFQRVGLICENSLRPLNDPELLKLLPPDIFQGGQVMIKNIKEELQLKSGSIDHLIMDRLWADLFSFEYLIDLCRFLMQRFIEPDKLRVIQHPNIHFKKIQDLDELLRFSDALRNQYSPDFKKIVQQWSLALCEGNRVVSVESELLTSPRDDLLIYDMHTLSKIPSPIPNQNYQVHRTIPL